MFTSIRSFLAKLSTKPHYESYTWGAHPSLFGRAFYLLVYWARFLSPLQWYKTIWRMRNENKASRDGKERQDFHALHSEYYLLAVLLLALFIFAFNDPIAAYVSAESAYLYQGLKIAKTVVLTWLLFESVLWILYYMLLRILIERRLSIFNEAEYFIALPVVLFTQIVLLASIFNAALTDTATAMFNLSYDESVLSSKTSVAIGLLGYVYTVLIIANIINLIPALPVRRRPNITIIGAGDVVEKRILPALMEGGFYRPGQLSIASDKINPSFKADLDRAGIAYFEGLASSGGAELTFSTRNKIRQDIANFVGKRSSYAIIATPTEEHFPYMTILADKDITFAIEKPIIGNRAELEAINAYGHEIMSGGFLLSYYWLEKALPLNYFLTLNANYRDFLDIHTDNQNTHLISQNTLAYIRQRLGKPTHVSVRFYEHEETRAWALLRETGGFYYDTFIHPVTLVYHVLDGQFEPSECSTNWYTTEDAQAYFSEQKSELGANFIHLRKDSGPCTIDVKAGKFTGQKTRCMTIQYRSGKVFVDLDKMRCEINWFEGGENASTTICIKPKYQKPYAAQMRLYDMFVNHSGTWKGQRFDDFPAQAKVLEKMLELLNIEQADNDFFHPEPMSQSEMAELMSEHTDDTSNTAAKY